MTARARSSSQLLEDSLDLKRMNAADLAALTRLVHELQRHTFALTSTQIVRAMVRGFVASLSAKSAEDRVSAVYLALSVAPGGIQ